MFQTGTHISGEVPKSVESATLHVSHRDRIPSRYALLRATSRVPRKFETEEIDATRLVDTNMARFSTRDASQSQIAVATSRHVRIDGP